MKNKKWELLKYAYDNYPKGTKCYWTIGIVSADTTIISTGEFNFIEDDCIIDTNNYTIFDGEKWAKIIEEPKEIEVPLYFMNQTAVVKTNSEVHILDGNGHIDAKLSFGDIVDILNAIEQS